MNGKEMLDKIFPQEKDFEVVKKTSERYGLVREILVSLQKYFDYNSENDRQ